MTAHSCDILIVGGGIIGSPTAYNLVKMDPRLKVQVVERDFSYERASTTLSAANLRTVGFSLKENYLLSKQTFKILETFEDDMAVDDVRPNLYLRREGNLLLSDATGLADAQAIFCHAPAIWDSRCPSGLEPDEIKQRWPLFDVSGYCRCRLRAQRRSPGRPCPADGLQAQSHLHWEPPSSRKKLAGLLTDGRRVRGSHAGIRGYDLGRHNHQLCRRLGRRSGEIGRCRYSGRPRPTPGVRGRPRK